MSEEPGDPVCWLAQLCPECGAVPSAGEEVACWRCGAAPPDDHDTASAGGPPGTTPTP